MNAAVEDRRAHREQQRRDMARREERRAAAEDVIVVPSELVTGSRRRADWSEWSDQHERQRIARETADIAARIPDPIYPREQAAKLAKDLARQLVPDWRLHRDEHRGAIARIIRDQPELQQRDVKRRDDLLNVIFRSLPSHLQPTLTDLRLLVGTDDHRARKRGVSHRGRNRPRA